LQPDDSKVLDMRPVLIPTKLILPPIRNGLIARARLGQKIESALAGGSRLVLVSAPAGSGKSITIRQWVASQDRPAAWYTLDDGDNDPVRFWTYFVSAIQSQIPNFGETVLSSLQTSQPVPVQSLAAQLINELVAYSRSLVIVIDDYHLIQNAVINEALTYLLENQPPQLVVVIASRADPPMPLARWRSRRQLVELRAADMRFTLAEINALLNEVMDLAISEGDLLALEAQTEGWAAGLQLAALALQTRLAQGTISPAEISSYLRQFSGSNRYILDYLVGEVLEQQPDQVRVFLLQTCILERLSSELCDFILDVSQNELPGGAAWPAQGITSSRSMLEYVERANLFLVALDDQRSWYRYHKLFGDLLRQRAQLEYKDRLLHLHRRAAVWYEQHGFPTDAIHHGLQARQWELVSQLVEQNTNAALARGETLTLSGWLKALPAEVVLTRPWLCVAAAWVHLLTGEMPRAAEYVDAAQRAKAQGSEPQVGTAFQGQISAIRAYTSLHQGRLEESKELAGRALDLLPEDDLVMRSFVAFTLGGACLVDDDLQGAQGAFLQASQVARTGQNVHIAAPSLRVIAQLLEARGELRQAEAYCWEAVELAKTSRGRSSPAAADAFGVLSDLYYEWNDLPVALDHARRGVELGELLGNPDVLTSAYGRMARLRYVDGDQTSAWEWLHKAEHLIAHASLTPGSGGSVRELRVRLWSATGDMVALGDWAQQQQRALEGLFAGHVVFLNEADVRTLARAWLRLGEPGYSQDLLMRHERWTTARDLPGMHIKNLVLQVLAYQATGERGESSNALEQALTLAEAQGYVRTFLDEGPDLQELLLRVRLPGSGISRSYLADLLAAYPVEEGVSGTAAVGPKQAPLVLIEPLSDREIEVLQLIADGYSNQQVAEQLFISLGTVKAHTASIYRKLDVRSRTQAVAVARELKLI
jgi:LuxR family maltose regulon positive regulatory protein